MDYRCGYCKKAFEDVAGLINRMAISALLSRNFQILGPQSELASRFAVAVLQIEGAQTYETAHDALMGMKVDVAEKAVAALAAEIGIKDMAAVTERMNAPEVTSVIEANRALAQRLDINGTPTFVIDQTLVRGYVPLEGMRQIVDGQRKG